MKLSKKATYGILIGMSFLYFIVLIVFCDMKSLWSDDLAQMEIALQPSIGKFFSKCIALDNNPPLSHLLSAVWIRLMPYGCGWLKSLNIILVTGGILVCGIVALDLMGQFAGVVSTGLLIANLGLVTLAAYTFRPYGLVFFLAALMMWIYERNRRMPGEKFEAGYFLVMLLGVYTHYFMVLICVGFFIADLILVVKRKTQIQILFSYPAAALGFLPWLLAVVRGSLERLQNFWPEKPDIMMLISSMIELDGGKTILLIVGVCNLILMGSLFWDCFHRQNEDKKTAIWFLLTMLPVSLIGGIYLLSRYSSQFTSLFVTRYFVCVLPELYVAAGCGAAILVKKLPDISLKKSIYHLSECFAIAIVLGLMIGSGYRIYTHEKIVEQPFREIADYLMIQPDIQNENVLVFHTSFERNYSWEYFVNHKSERENSIDNVWYQLEDNDLKGKNKVYISILHNELDETTLKLLQKEGYEKTEAVESLPVLIFEKKIV